MTGVYGAHLRSYLEYVIDSVSDSCLLRTEAIESIQKKKFVMYALLSKVRCDLIIITGFCIVYFQPNIEPFVRIRLNSCAFFESGF